MPNLKSRCQESTLLSIENISYYVINHLQYLQDHHSIDWFKGKNHRKIPYNSWENLAGFRFRFSHEKSTHWQISSRCVSLLWLARPAQKLHSLHFYCELRTSQMKHRRNGDINGLTFHGKILTGNQPDFPTKIMGVSCFLFPVKTNQLMTSNCLICLVLGTLLILEITQMRSMVLDCLEYESLESPRIDGPVV